MRESLDVAFTLDGQPEVRRERCDSCGRPYEWVTGYVLQDGEPKALYLAQCHGHDDRQEVWLDVVVGSWVEPFLDHATFGCRVNADGVGLVDAPVASRGQVPFSGSKLSRSMGIAEPRLPAVWAIVDFVVTTDPTISAHIYGGA